MTAVTPDGIAATILRLTGARAGRGSVCPSEVARALDPAGWRVLMPAVRVVAADLAARGTIAVTQGGRPVDPASTRGPVRLVAVTGMPGPGSVMNPR